MENIPSDNQLDEEMIINPTTSDYSYEDSRSKVNRVQKQ